MNQAVPKKSRKKDADVLGFVRDMPCCICGKWPVDAAHIKSKGSGGPDSPFNVLPFCRGHHSEQHTIGFKRMCDKYAPLNFRLRRMGWEWIEGRLWHPSLVKMPT